MNSELPPYSVKTRALMRYFASGTAVEILREQSLALGVREEVLEQILKISLLCLRLPSTTRCFGERIDDGVLVLG